MRFSLVQVAFFKRINCSKTLTCLVAAVFSETVWEGASQRLREALRPESSEGHQQADEHKAIGIAVESKTMVGWRWRFWKRR
jgi:hypothetical protein